MTTATETALKPDTIGLAVARVAQRAATSDRVIFFASRASGDHHAALLVSDA